MLQAMPLTDKEKMILTPTYYVFRTSVTLAPTSVRVLAVRP